MSDQKIIHAISRFFASEAWWKPVLDFLSTRSKVFMGTPTPTHQEYEVFLEFRDMVVDLIENKLCPVIGIRPDGLENLLEALHSRCHVQALVIADTLIKALDFMEFRQQMLQTNIRIETTITQTFLDVTADVQEGTDANEIAQQVAELVAKKEEDFTKEIIEKGCRQMRAMLSLDILNSQIHRSPRRSPKKIVVDPEEVARRKKFYEEQRDKILAEEEKNPPKRKPVRSPFASIMMNNRFIKRPFHSPQSNEENLLEDLSE